MEHLHHLTNSHSRVSTNIRVRAAKLARSGAACGMEAEDIEQDLRLDLIRRMPRFDETRASFETFADRLIAHRIASLAASTAAKRADRSMKSLEAPIAPDGENGGLTLADVTPEDAALYAPAALGGADGTGLGHDVLLLLHALSPSCRAVAIALGNMTASEAARALDLHRSSIYARIALIRAVATSLGLQDYFAPSPTVSRARR
jgi:RNA polymerase sigma-70 factor, ECF subfamily